MCVPPPHAAVARSPVSHENRCPACHSPQVVPIVYGLCAIGLVDADGRDVEIGDEATDGARWSCTSCAHRWTDEAR